MILILTIFVNQVYATPSNMQSKTTSQISSKTRLLINNEEFSPSSIVFKNNDLYIPIDEFSTKYNVYTKWSNKYKGVYMIDSFVKKAIYLKLDKDVIYYQSFNGTELDTLFPVYIDLKIKDEGISRIVKPCIYLNKKKYISTNYLKAILKFSRSYDSDSDILRLDRNSLNISLKEYFEPFIEENYNSDEFDKSYYTYDEAFKYFYDKITNPDENGEDGFNKIDEYSKLLTYIGKTFWAKKDKFYQYGDSGRVFNVKDVKTNKIVSDKKLGYFIKIKIEDVNSSNEFVSSINGVKCKFGSEIIINSSSDDYEIFTKDPTTIFKWSKSTWSKIANGNEYWIGMNYDMAVMTIGRPNDINRTVTSSTVYEQWVYSYGNSIPSTYLYFTNGKLTSWQD